MQVLKDALINDRKFPSTYDFFIINWWCILSKTFHLLSWCFKISSFNIWIVLMDFCGWNQPHILEKNTCMCVICGPFYLLMNPLCECLFRKTNQGKRASWDFPILQFPCHRLVSGFSGAVKCFVECALPSFSPLCVSWCELGRCVYECVCFMSAHVFRCIHLWNSLDSEFTLTYRTVQIFCLSLCP